MNKNEIIKELTKRNKTISVAESLTGGLLSSIFISVSGSSNVVNGSVVGLIAEDTTITRHVVFKDLPEFGKRDSVRKDIAERSMILLSDYLDPTIVT